MGGFGGLFDVFGGGGGGSSFSGGGIGSSQSAQSSTSTTTTLDMSRVDNSVLSEGSFRAGDINIVTTPGAAVDNPSSAPGSTLSGAGVNISMVDPGALQTARMIVADSLDQIGANLQAVGSVASDSISQAYQLAEGARKSETAGALQDFTRYGAAILIAGILGYVIVKGSKS